jgi:hypothetical protein
MKAWSLNFDLSCSFSFSIAAIIPIAAVLSLDAQTDKKSTVKQIKTRHINFWG